VQPDILFISRANRAIVAEKNIQGAPDLVVEIVSPNTRERDLVLKKKLYAKFGAKEYWLVFLNEQKIEVYRLEDQKYILDGVYEKPGALKSPLLKGLKIRLSEVFRDLSDYFYKTIVKSDKSGFHQFFTTKITKFTKTIFKEACAINPV
jgi:Uma2 family endonuclease